MINSRHKYPEEFKRMVVSRLDTEPVSEVARLYGLNLSVLHRWWRQIGNHRAKPCAGRRTYSKEFKEAAVRQLESGSPLDQVAAACKVRQALLRRWRAEFRGYGNRAFPGYGKSRTLDPNSFINVTLRFTDDEYRRLTKALSLAGNATLSNFVRDQVFHATSTEQPSVVAVEETARELAAMVRKLSAALAVSTENTRGQENS